jgi:crotonobetainyl-CoA:carnitine CoA-transferase CaiB-like acyl-CoA transferase
MLQTCWSALGGEPAMLETLDITRRDAWLGGPLAVDELAVAAVASALIAAAELSSARGAGRPSIKLDAEHVALSFRSERHVRIGGKPRPAGFAPLSRFVRCADGGWARTHCNYPHHAAALCKALGIEPTVEALEAAAARRGAEELENAVVAAGGCAAALRTADRWASHPAGRAAAAAPLVEWGRAHSAPTLRDRPIRVLDLTRVIAGPVAGRTLAALGAEVLRVDPPHLPELPEQHIDTGPGKRAAVLDLADGPRREALLAGADVVLIGYRPGALTRFGITPDALAARHPGLVQVSLCAWGFTGPWANRRGFDSLFQVASGIAGACAAPDGTPGALPAQALDHATGHLMAATALRGLAGRARGEPVAPARLSLARTAAALLATTRPQRAATAATGAADPERHRVTFDEISLIAPPGALDGVALRWPHGPRPLGGDPPSWD